MSAGKRTLTIADALDGGAQVLRLYSETQLVVGDDAGGVRCFDVRAPPPPPPSSSSTAVKKGSSSSSAAASGKAPSSTSSMSAAAALVSAKSAWSHLEHGDFVSDMLCVRDKHHLLVTSGDATLSVYDMRKVASATQHKLRMMGIRK